MDNIWQAISSAVGSDDKRFRIVKVSGTPAYQSNP